MAGEPTGQRAPHRTGRGRGEGARRGAAIYLRGNVVVWQTGSGEEGDLLAARHRVHAVNGRDTGLDHLLGVRAHLRVDGLTVDVKEVLRQHSGALVDGLAGAVEDAAKHVIGDRRGENVARELDGRTESVDARRALEDLHDGLRALHLKHLARARRAVGKGQVDNLRELGRADILRERTDWRADSEHGQERKSTSAHDVSHGSTCHHGPMVQSSVENHEHGSRRPLRLSEPPNGEGERVLISAER